MRGHGLSTELAIWIYWGLAFASLFWCAWRGLRPERIAAGLVLAAFVATQLATPLEIGGWRVGVALVDTAAFILLMALAVRFDRWWLIAAAATQFVTVLTHLVGFLEPGLLLRTNVLVRWILGLTLLGALAVGPSEAARLKGLDARS